MDNLYGINVKNKFDLFYDEDVDPLELLAQQESNKKTEQDKKKKDDKGKKTKNAKKPVLKSENKNKQQEEIKPEKEEKVNASRQSDRPRSVRQNREREDNRPPRRRDENFNPEHRNERSEGGFGRTDRNDGNRSEGGMGRGEGGFGRGRGRGGRGDRGGRGRGGRGGFKREFERHSGSDRTGVKATEKREGSGSHNWGTVKDDIDLPPKVDYWRDPKEQMKETTEETTPDWNQQPSEDAENKDPNESTESATVEEPEDDQPKQMTLEEWKAQENAKRVKSQFKVRRAGEGVDNSQWKTGRVYRKSEGDEEEESEEEESDEDDDEDELKNKRLINEIRITFNDSPRRGRGSRRPRGPRGGRGSGRGGERRNPNAAPKFDDENDFPSLIKTEA